MTAPKLCLLVLLLTLGTTPTIFASQTAVNTQQRYGRQASWLTFGYGAAENPGMMALGGSISFKRDNLLMSIRVLYGTSEGVDVGPTDKLREYGQLFGICRSNSSSVFSASCGIALVNMTRVKYTNGLPREIENIATVGFPMEVRAFRTDDFLGLDLGLGLHGYANINSERSYVGILLSILAGSL
jgi:hypothetical protein